jgi:hypothetical protein
MNNASHTGARLKSRNASSELVLCPPLSWGSANARRPAVASAPAATTMDVANQAL